MDSISRYINDQNIKGYLEVEIVDTPEKRAKGLMNIHNMKNHQGMLFVFPTIVDDAFWGKNLLIPLDIAFISDRGEIVDIRQIEAHDTRRIKSSVPYQFALEVHKGWFDKKGISVGMRIQVDGTKLHII